MVIGTVEAWQVDKGDFILIDGEECTVKETNDDGEVITIEFFDAFGESDSAQFDPYIEFDIWGN